LARAHRDGDGEAVKSYVRGGVRLALVIAGAMVSVTSGLAGPLLRLIFPAQAAELGTESMQLLTLGFGAFALFGILTTVLNSLQQERASTIVTGIAFALVVLLCFGRARGTELSPELLFRTAFATTAGIALATLAAAVLVKRTAGAVVAPLSLLRVVGATAVAIAVARFLPSPGKVMTIAYAALVGAIYLALLLVTRELGREDVANVRAIVSRRKQA
jgi:stage V sporulation protein B